MAKAVKKKKANETKTRWSIEKVVVPIVVAIIGAIGGIAAIVGIVLKDDASAPPPCSIGMNRPCQCEDGRDGSQNCDDDGAKWLPCKCPSISAGDLPSKTRPVAPTEATDAPSGISPEPYRGAVVASADGKAESKKDTQTKKNTPSSTGTQLVKSDVDLGSLPEKVTGSAVCTTTNCTLTGIIPDGVTNVCLDVKVPDDGDYRQVSRCLVNRRGIKTTCTRTGNDNLDRLSGDIRWRSPCP